MRLAYFWLLVGTWCVGCQNRQPTTVMARLNSPSAPTVATSPKSAPSKDRVVLTDRAVLQLRRLFKENESSHLRISVSDSYRFKLDLVGSVDPHSDHTLDYRGIPIVVSARDFALIPVGLTVDYHDQPGMTGFSVRLPVLDRSTIDTETTLADARRGFKTTLVPRKAYKSPVPRPPAEVFNLVKYDAAPGKLSAYLSPDPKDGQKHPAIVWITGGDCNSIDAGCWREGPVGNDQSASVYRKAGIVMMFPALRGGNDNPGEKEAFFGEVDDVLAAAEFLSQQPYVDPKRIYLGGHSTGGTLALLVAECSDRFRAVFSFGPVDDIGGYGLEFTPFALSNPHELRLRAPGLWLHSIKSPVFVIEGERGNADDLRRMKATPVKSPVRFFEIKGADHFNVLAPANRLIAAKLLADTGATCNLAFSDDEFNEAMKQR